MATAHDDYSVILFKALADRLAEAFAECLHHKVRTDLWGYAPVESLTPQELIAERYQGIRPAPGYPACPDHSVKREMFALLRCDEIGMTLGHASGGQRERLLPGAPAGAVFQCGASG